MVDHLNGAQNRVTGDLTQFVGELAKRADLNHDGSVSGAEFARFLTGMMEKPDAASTTGEARTAGLEQALSAIGRILRGFPATPSGLLQALPEIQRGVPGTTLFGHDQLDIPDIGRINVS